MPKNYSSELEELLVTWQNGHMEHASQLMKNMPDVIKDHKGYGDVYLWLLPITMFPELFHSALNSGMKHIDLVVMTNLRSHHVFLKWLNDQVLCEFMVENNYDYFNEITVNGLPEEMYNEIDINDSNVQIILEYLPVALRKSAENEIYQQNQMKDQDYALVLNNIRNAVQNIKHTPSL